jgi:hypothetical protein
MPTSCFSFHINIISIHTCLDNSSKYIPFANFRSIEDMVFQAQDAWRTHPMFQNLWKSPFPGFRRAAIIYGVYLGAEFAYKTIMAPTHKTIKAAH